jgi:hypothetical protein
VACLLAAPGVVRWNRVTLTVFSSFFPMKLAAAHAYVRATLRVAQELQNGET